MSLASAYGAVGDGVVDDASALQHAIDNGDGVLELAKGVYRITRPLVLDLARSGPLGLRGDQGTARLVMDGPGPAVRIVGEHRGTAQPASVRPSTWERERLPIVSGLEILGRHDEADGVQLLRTMQATLQSVLIRRCRFGVHLVERNRNFLLANSHIYDGLDTGVFFDQCNLHQVIITGNHISYCKRAGIRQLNGDVHNIQIAGNDIEYNSGAEDPLSGEIVLAAPEGVISEYTITGNTLQATPDAQGANLLVLGRSEDPPAAVRLVSVAGNVLGSRDRNIVIRHGSRISIAGNTIYGGTALNVALTCCQNTVLTANTICSRPAGYASKSADGVLLERCAAVLVSGNILNDCRYGDESAGGCITLRGCRDVAVSHCQILEPQVRGIDLQDSIRCCVAGNTISHQQSPAAMLCAVRVAGDSRHNVVQNNVFRRGRLAGIDCDASRGEVSGNTLWE